MNEATVRLQCADAAAAETARAALQPDNDGLLEAAVEGNVLVLTANSASIMGLLRTMDDALGCLRATGMD